MALVCRIVKALASRQDIGILQLLISHSRHHNHRTGSSHKIVGLRRDSVTRPLLQDQRRLPPTDTLPPAPLTSNSTNSFTIMRLRPREAILDTNSHTRPIKMDMVNVRPQLELNLLPTQLTLIRRIRRRSKDNGISSSLSRCHHRSKVDHISSLKMDLTGPTDSNRLLSKSELSL